jgi:hypothetical protein
MPFDPRIVDQNVNLAALLLNGGKAGGDGLVESTSMGKIETGSPSLATRSHNSGARAGVRMVA